VDNLQYINW